jgi:hypothetical protein
MTSFRKRVLFSSVFLLSACGSVSRVVVLQNPQTKQTVECRVDPWGDSSRTRQIDHCVNAYRKAGYEVVGDSESE